MKKISILLLTIVSLVFLGLHGVEEVYADEGWIVETFGQVEESSSYTGEQSYTSVDNGLMWELRGRGDQTLDGKAWTLGNAADNSFVQVTATNGISSFSLEVVRAFGNSNARTLELFINDVSIETFSVSTSSDNKQIWTIDDINIAGNVVIKVISINTGSRGATIVDNFKWTSYAPSTEVVATVNQLFGPDNDISVNVDAVQYGQDITIPVTDEVDLNQFQFGLVNGVIREDFAEKNTFPITDGLEVSLVYGSETNHAVLFVDSNGKLISNTWVGDGANVTVPSTSNLSKPGYVVSPTNPWLSNEGNTSLENITSSRVYTLQYELNENPVQITVNGSQTEYAYNQIVTVRATNESTFKAWTENGRVVSTKPSYTFTALTDRVLEESTDADLVDTKVVLSNDLKLREGYQSFVGQLNLNEGEVLVEYGLVLSEDGLLRDEDLTLDNGVKARSDVLVPTTNEFLMSVDESYLVVRAYVVTRDDEGNLNTYYSDHQYHDVAIVTFDSDGGTELDPIAVKNGSAITEPDAPDRPSHEFLGWYRGEDEFDFETEVTEDLTLTAKWLEVLPTIAEVRALDVNEPVEFKGIVTGFDGDNMFVQDETAAINVFRGNLPEGLVVGDEVRIIGSRSVFSGLQQIGSGATVTIETRENTLPPVWEIETLTELSTDNQSMRVSLSGINLTVQSQSGNNLTLTDGVNTILVYAATGSDMYTHIQDAIIGQKVDIVEAHVGWFNGLQLTVLDVENLVFVELSDEELVQLDLDEIILNWDNKEFNMESEIVLPTTGSNGTSIEWVLDPLDAIEDGKWKTVTEDTEVSLEVIVTKGDATISDVILVTILYVDPNATPDPETIIDFTSTGKESLPSGWSHIGLGNNYAESRLRFDNTGDQLTTHSLGIQSGTVIRVTIEGIMNVGSGTGRGQLEVRSGTTVLGTIELNANPVTTYTIDITLNVNVDKLSLYFSKDNGNLGLGKLIVITNPN